MEKEMKKVPAIRFKGFTGDWEQRKFSELFKRRMERNNGQFDKTKWISVANMYYQDPDKVTSNNIDTRTYVLRLGDISFEGHSNKEFKIGRFVENDIGDGVISELFPIYQHITSYDLNFWKYYINIENIMFPKLQRCIEVSYTSSNKLSEKFFLKESILVPAILEQKKIGTYLKKIDNLITLHQRKSDQLKKLKAYFLQNLFPAKGEKVPKIRFKGFTGDWEERKIGDCFDERKEGMPNGELLSVTINEGVKRFSELERHDSSNQDKSKYKKVCIGDIAYNSMRMWQGASGVSTYEGIVSPAYTILKPKNGINSKFVSYLFKKKDILYIFQVNSQGITSDNWNLKFPILSKISIRVPASIKEQNKIAKQMEKIDDIITLHQQKIAQFQAVKKFLLQNLFV